FQAEDGIRDYKVTGVQTCALPILNAIESRTSNDPTNAREGQMALSIRNLDAPLGAEARGIDLSKSLTQADADAIEEAWRERHVRSEERRVGKECRAGGGRGRGRAK